jgi:hypothetical protein
MKPSEALRREGECTVLDPADPEVWFPRAGAYNATGRALYFGRRARRCMKKSASYDHYYTQWGRQLPGNQMLWTMAKGPNLLPWNAAKLVMENNAMSSVAIGPNLIMCKTDNDNEYDVVYRGLEIGRLTDEVLEPSIPGHPLNIYAIRALNRRDVQCHLSN